MTSARPSFPRLQVGEGLASSSTDQTLAHLSFLLHSHFGSCQIIVDLVHHLDFCVVIAGTQCAQLELWASEKCECVRVKVCGGVRV